jgi:polyhydroxyalkanoate synthase subunit PhaC
VLAPAISLGHQSGRKPQYQYSPGDRPTGEFEAWLAKASEHPGSGWHDWFAWVAAQSPERVAPRVPGAGQPPRVMRR